MWHKKQHLVELKKLARNIMLQTSITGWETFWTKKDCRIGALMWIVQKIREWTPCWVSSRKALNNTFVRVHCKLKNYLQRRSLCRVQDKELLKQVFTVGRHVEGYAVLAPQHSFSQLSQCWAVKRQRATHQSVQNHTERPHIHLRSIILFACNTKNY